MPLKIADINAPASTNIINTWADSQEETITQHSSTLSRLQNQLVELFKKNPTLSKPTGF